MTYTYINLHGCPIDADRARVSAAMIRSSVWNSDPDYNGDTGMMHGPDIASADDIVDLDTATDRYFTTARTEAELALGNLMWRAYTQARRVSFAQRLKRLSDA